MDAVLRRVIDTQIARDPTRSLPYATNRVRVDISPSPHLLQGIPARPSPATTRSHTHTALDHRQSLCPPAGQTVLLPSPPPQLALHLHRATTHRGRAIGTRRPTTAESPAPTFGEKSGGKNASAGGLRAASRRMLHAVQPSVPLPLPDPLRPAYRISSAGTGTVTRGTLRAPVQRPPSCRTIRLTLGLVLALAASAVYRGTHLPLVTCRPAGDIEATWWR